MAAFGCKADFGTKAATPKPPPSSVTSAAYHNSQTWSAKPFFFGQGSVSVPASEDGLSLIH